MLNLIKKWLLVNQENNKGYVSGLEYKADIKALGYEEYQGINIIYLSKPGDQQGMERQPVYQFFYKKEFYSEEADTLDELKKMAHNKIDIIK